MPVIDLTIDPKGAIKGLNQYDKAVTKSSKKTKTAFDQMKGYAKGFAAAFAGYRIVDTVKDIAFASVTMASSLVEAQGVFDQAFGAMSTTAEQWATKLGNSYHLSEVTAKQSLSTFQLVLTGMNVATGKAADMSNALVKVGADLGAAFDRKTVDVVRDIRSALSGSMETMDKYGVVLRMAQVEAKALAMGLAKTKKEITQADRATATYAIILEKSKTLMGTTAREAKGYAGQLKEARKNVDNLVTALGEKLMPVFIKVLTKFNEWITTGDRANKIINGTIEVVRALVNGYFGLETVLKGTIVVIAKLAEGFVKLATPMKWVLEGLKAVGTIDTNPLAELEMIMEDFTASAVEGFGTTIDKIEKFNAMMDKARQPTEKLKDEVKKIGTEGAPQVDKAKDAVKDLADAASKTKDNVGDLKDEEKKLGDEVAKVTANAKESTTALDKQAVAASKVASAVNKIADANQRTSATKEGTYKASKAWSGGSTSFGGGMDLTDEEMQIYMRMTPAGRGTDFYDTYGSGGRSGGTHDYLDKILLQQKAAMDFILKRRKGEESVTNNYYFNQQVSRSDIAQISEGQNRYGARA